MRIREIEPDTVPALTKVSQMANRVQEHGTYQYDAKVAAISAVKVFFGAALIFFGLTNTGSYYTSAGMFHGTLADIFYGYQAGTLMAIVGVLLIYDSMKRIKLL